MAGKKIGKSRCGEAKELEFEFEGREINNIGISRCGEAKEFEFEFKERKLITLGNQGVGIQNSLNLNLKGGKLINLGNQGVGRQKFWNFNLKGIILINLGKQGAGRCIFYLNLTVSRWTELTGPAKQAQITSLEYNSVWRDIIHLPRCGCEIFFLSWSLTSAKQKKCYISQFIPGKSVLPPATLRKYSEFHLSDG